MVHAHEQEGEEEGEGEEEASPHVEGESKVESDDQLQEGVLERANGNVGLEQADAAIAVAVVADAPKETGRVIAEGEAQPYVDVHEAGVLEGATPVSRDAAAVAPDVGAVTPATAAAQEASDGGEAIAPSVLPLVVNPTTVPLAHLPVRSPPPTRRSRISSC